jgi:hypothetical protein
MFNPADGTGFVGKGDVQLVYGWSNAQLQTNAGSVQFRYVSTDVTEVTWECTKAGNPNIQEKNRITTTETQSVVDSIARTGPSQITGFNITSYSGPPVKTSSTDGPPLNTCPNGWVLSPAGAPVPVSSVGHVQVSTDGTTWTNLIWPTPTTT